MVSPPILLPSATERRVSLNFELCALNLEILGKLGVDSAHIPQV